VRITKLTLHSFRGISDLVVSPVEGMNLYIGRNGEGKSTILDAAAIALSWYTARFVNRNANGKPIRMDEIQNGKREASISIEVEVDNQLVGWTIYGYREGPLERKKSDFSRLNRYLDSIAEGFEKGNMTIPVVCYYPTTRAFVDVPKRIYTRHDFSKQLLAYEGSLEIGADFRSFFEWFKEEEDAENEEARTHSGYRSPELDGVRAAVESFTGFTRLQVKRRPHVRMSLVKGHEEVEVSQLSDGEQIYLALVGDLARRILIANRGGAGPSKVLAEASGVVLIDEVELHLHPSWQRNIIGRLKDVFPHIQFLVTTHSPQVVGEASRDSAWILDRKTGLSPLRLSYGASSDVILEGLMETSSRSEAVKQEIAGIYALIDGGKLDEARKGLEGLRERIGDDPETARIAAVIRRREVLGK